MNYVSNVYSQGFMGTLLLQFLNIKSPNHRLRHSPKGPPGSSGNYPQLMHLGLQLYVQKIGLCITWHLNTCQQLRIRGRAYIIS